MHSRWICGLMLILPLITYTACSDDDGPDDTADAGASSGGRAGASVGGRAGASTAGRAGANNAAGRAGASFGGSVGLAGGGAAGEDSSDAGSGGSGISGGGTGGRGGNAGTAGLGGRGGAGGRGGSSGSGGSSGRAGSGGSGGSGGRSGAGGGGGTAGAVGGSGGGAGTAGGGGAGGQTQALNDSQIVKVLSTANQGEIAAAQAAQPAAQTAPVKNFAAMMIADHTAANALTLALVSTKHIPPQTSGVSEHLEDDAAALLATLSQTPQANFDRVYLQSQIAMHQEVLTLIDTQLLPNASDPDLKTLTADIRVSVAAHLLAAQTLFAEL